MIANYVKVFIRLFFRQTAFTLINILGLAVGLACCLIIALYVRHEFSFDRFYANADVLYRAGTVVETPSGRVDGAGTFFPVAPMLENNFPEIIDSARIALKPSLISSGDTTFREDGFRLADPAFFRVFDFVWLQGDPASALDGPTDVVLTRSTAEKYFGDGNPLGQSLLLSEGVALRVTGVIEDLPTNTHLSGTIFAAMALRDVLEPVETRTGEWSNAGYHTYVLLRPDVNIEQLRRELDAFGRASIPASPILTFTLKLDAVTDIHLNTPPGADMKPLGSKLTIAVFTAVGIGILLVACANFVNLSTARSAQRFGEVGLRLTLGASRAQLMGQFLGESVLFVLLALVAALALVELLLPGIQAFLGLDLAFDSLADPLSLSVLLGAGLVLGLVAGWYPALLMSRFKPATALKKPLASRVRGMALKNVLVVLQFAVAIGMIVASMVIYVQMQFAGALELGFDHDQVVVVRTSELGSTDRIRVLKERLLQGEGITAAAVSEATPERVGRIAAVSTEGEEEQHEMAYFSVDFDYFSLYDIPLLTGRLLSEDMPTDLIRTMSGDPAQTGGSFLLNESAARELGWSAGEAVGKRIFEIQFDGTDATTWWFRVVGVVGDTIQSAYTPATPAIYVVEPADLDSDRRRLLSLRLEGRGVAETLAFIDRAWNEVNPDEPIVRTFLDDNIEARYRADSRRMHLAFGFAAMAIFISCMGLFGLANFNAQRRTKEIGVRKVMGGSVWRIVLLLTNDFSKLVLISNLIAWPVAWFAMERWLENFAYRIDLTPLVFIGSGLIALCIAWMTVGGTAARAASAKPVLALRYE